MLTYISSGWDMCGDVTIISNPELLYIANRPLPTGREKVKEPGRLSPQHLCPARHQILLWEHSETGKRIGVHFFFLDKSILIIKYNKIILLVLLRGIVRITFAFIFLINILKTSTSSLLIPHPSSLDPLPLHIYNPAMRAPTIVFNSPIENWKSTRSFVIVSTLLIGKYLS